MKTVKLYLVPLFLILSSAFIITNTVKIKKNVEIEKAKIVIDETKTKLKEVTAADVITVKQLIESIALKNNLAVSITPEKTTLKIVPQADIKNDNKHDVLNKYENIMSFISTISALPYQMEYQTFAMGADCPTGYEMTINIKAVN